MKEQIKIKKFTYNLLQILCFYLHIVIYLYQLIKNCKQNDIHNTYSWINWD